MTDAAPHPKLDELIFVLERLRAPGGCAWDREQTHESLVRHLIEETYELVDAIESGDREEMIEELGDVLYQVIFHSDIAAVTAGEDFTLEDVASRMTAKMVGRHPHVFGDATADTADDVIARWEELKAVEKPARTSVLDGIPQSMPSLLLADKLLGRAEKVGLDPREYVLVTETVSPGDENENDEEHDAEARLGAELLAVVVDARGRGLDAERALRTALRTLQRDIRSSEAGPAVPSHPAH